MSLFSGSLTPEPEPIASTSTAPFRHFPKTIYTSIEYPGPVSHPAALLRIVSQNDINQCFNAPSNASSESKSLEMRYRGLSDRQSDPVVGTRVPSQKLLLKVIRRRRKVQSGKGKERDNGVDSGVFTAEVLGTIANTVRFRSMADWHYTPPQDGPIAQTVRSLIDLDYNAILEYSVPRLNENYVEPITPPADGGPDNREFRFRSTMELQPTPMMGTRPLPNPYNFKMPPQTVEEEVYDERTGQNKIRYVNKARHLGFSLQVIGHLHPPGDVPKEPADAVKEMMPELDQALLGKLQKFMADRPMWLRFALLAQFTIDEVNTILTNKAYLPAVAYTMGAGPFWKTMIRFGYDPCISSESRIYQRIHFFTQVIRNKASQPNTKDDEMAAVAKKPKGWWQAEQEERIKAGKRPPLDRSKEYIFDGLILHRDRPDYQLCDLTDPLLAKYVNDPSNVTAVCDPRDGWYNNATMELIKNMFRIKYMHIYETGEPASNLLCAGVIAEYDNIMAENEDQGGGVEDATMKRIRVPRSLSDKEQADYVVPPLDSGTEMAMQLAAEHRDRIR